MSALDWQKLFDQHLDILRKHLDLLVSVQKQQAPDSEGHGMALGCVDRTQEMLRDFEKLSTSLNAAEQQDADAGSQVQEEPLPKNKPSPVLGVRRDQSEPLTLRPSKRRRTEDDAGKAHTYQPSKVIKDPSGLFSIDSNPTPVDILSSSKSIGRERGKPTKRPKNRDSKPKKSKATVSGNTESMPPGAATDTKFHQDTNEAAAATTTTTQPSAEQDDEVFLAKFRKRHQEKEEKRKKKQDKKRKRESTTSIDSQVILEPTELGKRKRKKSKLAAEAEPAQTSEQTSSPPKSGHKRTASNSREREKRQRQS